MMNKEHIDQQNQDAYDDLIVSIEASVARLNILIAVCDDLEFRDEIIRRYEIEVSPIRSYRTTLARHEPSLRSALDELIEKEEYLHYYNNQAVITVTGAEELISFKLDDSEDQSELEKFFGYLQWTREALRHYRFSIVLWLTSNLVEQLSRKAPDFWSWRAGVFRFIGKQIITSKTEILIPINSDVDNTNQEDEYFLPLAELLSIIEEIEKSENHSDKMLSSLYVQAGKIYSRRLKNSTSNNSQEFALAIEYFTKAINIQEKLGADTELIIILENLASLYKSQGKYSEAESIHTRISELTKQATDDKRM